MLDARKSNIAFLASRIALRQLLADMNQFVLLYKWVFFLLVTSITKLEAERKMTSRETLQNFTYYRWGRNRWG